MTDMPFPYTFPITLPEASTPSWDAGHTRVDGMGIVTMKRGDLLPAIEVSLLDGNGAAIDLTEATVVFRMRRRTDAVLTVDDQPCTVVDAEAGRVRYEFAGGETDAAGLFGAEFIGTIAGRQLTVPAGGRVGVEILDRL